MGGKGKNSLGKISLLSDDEVRLIFKRLSNQGDRKFFSQVCMQWLRVAGLTRPSILRLGPEFLSQFPNLVAFETTSEHITESTGFLFEYVSDTDLLFVAITCPKLSKVSLRTLRYPAVSIRSASFIKFAHSLTYLDLGHCSVEDESLIAIGSSCSISYLNLEWCFSITDKGLCFLANGNISKTLKTLVLAWCIKLTNVGVSQLPKMHCLEDLNLACVYATDDGDVALSRCKRLKRLNLDGLMRVSGRTIVALARNCRSLEWLDISWSKVTGAGIRRFSSHMCLETLVLRFYGVFDDANAFDVEHLILACPSLKSIVVDSITSKWVLPLMQESSRRFLTVEE